MLGLYRALHAEHCAGDFWRIQWIWCYSPGPMGGLRLGKSLFFGALVVVSCSGPVPPPLDESYPQTRKVRLDGKITAAKVREIAEALNESGRFPALNRFIRSASDESLDAWGEVVGRYWYLDADRPSGLVGLVQRLPHSWWSDFARGFDLWARENRPSVELFQETFGHPRFSLASKLLAPFLTLRLPSLRSTALDEPITVEKAIDLVVEIGRLLEPPSSHEGLSRVLSGIANRSSLHAMKVSFLGMRKTYGPEFSKSSSEQLSRLLSEPFVPIGEELPTNPVSALFELAGSLNRSSQGAIQYLSTSLSQNAAVRQVFDQFLSERVRSIATEAVFREFQRAGLTQNDWLALSDSTTISHKNANRRFFDIILKALRPITTIPSSGPEDVRFERAVSLNLNTLALSQWVRETARINRDTIAQMDGSHFAAHWFSIAMNHSAMDIKVAIFDGGRWQLDEGVASELDRLGLGDFAEELAQRIGQFPGLRYRFEMRESKSIKEILPIHVGVLDSTRQLIQTHEAAGLILHLVAAEESGLPITARSFETENILVSLLAWFRDRATGKEAAADLDSIMKLAGLDSMAPSDIRLLKKLFDGKPEWQSWLDEILPRLPALSLAVGLAKNSNTSLAEWLHHFLQGISNEELRELCDSFARLAEIQPLAPGRFPQIVAFLGQQRRSERWFNWITEFFLQISDSELDEVSQNGSPVIFKSWLEIVRDASRTPSRLAHVISQSRIGFDLPGGPTPEVSRWIADFLKSDGLELLFRAVGPTPRGHLLGLMGDLEAATERGDTRRALVQLSFIEDVRFRRGIEVLLDLERRGELLSFVRLVKSTLS